MCAVIAHGMSLSARKGARSEEHTSELQSRLHLVCRLLLEKKNAALVDAPGGVLDEVAQHLIEPVATHPNRRHGIVALTAHGVLPGEARVTMLTDTLTHAN